ncbi:hypothetical protein FB451DRAFT_1197410 [Mycena latifolia]|nr:hypothetical protein FB451DRAFT_1197410 [Mycena latifolia]
MASNSKPFAIPSDFLELEFDQPGKQWYSRVFIDRPPQLNYSQLLKSAGNLHMDIYMLLSASITVKNNLTLWKRNPKSVQQRRPPSIFHLALRNQDIEPGDGGQHGEPRNKWASVRGALAANTNMHNVVQAAREDALLWVEAGRWFQAYRWQTDIQADGGPLLRRPADRVEEGRDVCKMPTADVLKLRKYQRLIAEVGGWKCIVRV